MKIALLTTDNRQPFRQFDRPEPFFGTAPEALLQGFAALPGVEVHVVACIRQPVPSPEKLAPNIFFHSVVVPKIGWMRTLYQGCVRATRKKLREIQPQRAGYAYCPQGRFLSLTRGTQHKKTERRDPCLACRLPAQHRLEP